MLAFVCHCCWSYLKPHRARIVSCDKGIALLHFVVLEAFCVLASVSLLALLLSSNCPQPRPLFLAIILHSPAKILYPLLVGSRCDPNEEIPDFGSHCEPKVRVSHSFGSRCEPKTGDLTSGSRCEPREWGWSPFLDHIVSPRRSDPCLCLITLWAKRRQDNQHNGTLYTYVAAFTKQKAVHHHHIRVKLHHSRVGRRRSHHQPPLTESYLNPCTGSRIAAHKVERNVRLFFFPGGTIFC